MPSLPYTLPRQLFEVKKTKKCIFTCCCVLWLAKRSGEATLRRQRLHVHILALWLAETFGKTFCWLFDLETSKNMSRNCTCNSWLFDWLESLGNQHKYVKNCTCSFWLCDWLRTMENQQIDVQKIARAILGFLIGWEGWNTNGMVSKLK